MQKTKVYGSFDSKGGGFKSQSIGSGEGRHVTAVVAVSATGHKAPPFFILQGKRVMSNWLSHQDADVYQDLPPSLSSLLKKEWFPGKGVIVCTENGSMTMDIMPHFVTHLKIFVRTIVPPSVSYCVTIDGHSFRKGVDWIEQCIKYKA